MTASLSLSPFLAFVSPSFSSLAFARLLLLLLTVTTPPFAPAKEHSFPCFAAAHSDTHVETVRVSARLQHRSAAADEERSRDDDGGTGAEQKGH